nr:MAG TPA: hypothetical protein [Caudoviricetes sp.]
MIKLYYRKIRRKRRSSLRTTGQANSYSSTFLLFIKKLCPSWGLLIFFKNFFVSAVRFRPSAFGKVL